MAKNPINNAEKNPKEGFVTWNDPASLNEALKSTAKNIDAYTIVTRQNASASRYQNYKDVDTNVNVRPSFGRDNYEYFREKESTPVKNKDVMIFSHVAYKTVGIIRNIVDLMADFASEGIRLVHPVPKVERFYREWWKKIEGPVIAERFLNYFYRLGTVPVRRMTAKLKQSDIEKIQRTFGADIEIELLKKPEKREIPWKYVFLNPMMIESITPELNLFLGKPSYALKINEKIARKIANPSNQYEKELVSNLPSDVLAAVNSGNKILPLDPSNHFFYFYKKDDWEDFGSPMIGPLVDDILLLEKLRMADAAACDGAISQVRLWRLGSLEHKILPNQSAINKLSDILTNHVGGGSYDLVWGPELDFKESTTSVHNFLGKEKYEPTLNNIYAGLGIPPTLTGADTAGGFTNNYISLKTLIERLNYGRSVMQCFIEQELEYVRMAMGFKYAAKIVYNRMTLSDENAEKQLLLQLVDRDLISVETVLERFNEIPELEKARMKKEYKAREKDKLPSKLGPYSSPETDYTKLFIQSGVLSPSEVGIETYERKAGEKSPIDFKIETDKQRMSLLKKKGVSGEGRPLSSKDSKQRKMKTVKPRTSAINLSVLSSWAKDVYGLINDTVLPVYLKNVNKTTARGLTNEQFEIFEDIKFNILCSINPLTKVNKDIIYTALAKNNVASEYVQKVYNNLLEVFKSKVREDLSIEDDRNLRICAYSLVALEKEGINNG